MDPGTVPENVRPGYGKLLAQVAKQSSRQEAALKALQRATDVDREARYLWLAIAHPRRSVRRQPRLEESRRRPYTRSSPAIAFLRSSLIPPLGRIDADSAQTMKLLSDSMSSGTLKGLVLRRPS